MKKRIHSFILAAVAALAALAVSCMQLLDPPSAVSAAGPGRVVLTVSTGAAGSARTILPTETPEFSRYDLVFDNSAGTVTVTDTSAIAGDGVSQELDAGDWTATVRAYRRFTPTGGGETEYLAARGSASIAVTGGQITPVTVYIAPVPVTDTGVKGILTYTVSFPPYISGDSISGTLTIGAASYPLSNGETASVELDPGYYDLVVSLSAAAGTRTAGASEKAHIYSGLESKAVYTFTGADFIQTVPLAGTVTLDGGATLSGGTIGVYDASHELITTVAIPAGGTSWALGVPTSHVGSTLSFKLDAFGSDGNIYTAAGTTAGAVTEAGERNVTLAVERVIPVSLSYNTWADGDIGVAGELDWYAFTATNAAAYSLQWDDRANYQGDKTVYLSISAYRGDGTPVFTNYMGGYTSPRSVSASAGETIYVRVEGSDMFGDQSDRTGTYAIRYYDPAAVPPQTAPSYVTVRGTPAPACVLTWSSVNGATGYNVYRSTSGTFDADPLATPNAASYTDTALTAGTTYYYKVRAVNGIGEGPESPVASDTPPAAGTPLTHNIWTDGDISTAGGVVWYTFTAAAETTYALQWDDESNYRSDKTLYAYVSVYRSDGTPVFTNESHGYDYPKSVSASSGETVYVRVESQGGTGTYALRYYNPTAVPPYAAPSIGVRVIPSPACVVTWYSVNGATDYNVYRSTSGTFDTTPLATLSAEDTYTYTYTDTAVTAGTTYYYKVAAVNGNGEGPLYAVVSGTPPVGTVTPLIHNTWTDGDISVTGEVNWYTFTTAAAATYYVQWDGGRYHQGSGAYSCDISVSAYRGDGTHVFSGGDDGYTWPPSFSASSGEIIYVRVESGQSGETGTGTYALRYYDPAASPPYAAPANVRVQGTPAPGCVLTWYSVSEATDYNVYRSTSGTFGADPLATLSAEDTYTYTDTTVTAGTTYYYKVAAVNGNGEGPLSAAVSGTPPAAGTLLSHNTWTDGDISAAGEVHWYTFDAAAGATYYVQWDDWYNSGTGGKTLFASVSAYHSDGTPVFTNATYGYTNPRSFSASNGETIYVQVAGYGNPGTYAVRYYDPAASPPRAAPLNVRAQGNPAPGCVLTWYSVTGATGYNVYRSTSGIFGAAPLATSSAASYTDTALTPGTAYYYKVAAVNGNGEGPLSAVVSDTPPAAGTPLTPGQTGTSAWRERLTGTPLPPQRTQPITCNGTTGTMITPK